MIKITEILAKYVADLHYGLLPPEVPERARHLAIDLIGSIVRAGKEADSTPSLLGMIKALGLDAPGQCTVFGSSRNYIPATAALLNGALGHSLDFDDTHADSSLHPSAPVVPAAYAAAEMVGASGKELLAAIVAGYEVCCRLGNALDPTAHYARGFHPTATAGTFGAAAAAGKLLGLDAAGIASAFGVAGSQAAGSLQFLVNGAWNKRYQVGAAAMNGLIAATLAKEGFVGAADAIEGKHGFLVGYTDDPLPERAVADLGTVYETMNIGMKPYPACRYTHAAVDGLLKLRRENGWSAADILSVDIGLHKNGIVLTGAPLQAKRRPRSVVEGQFSMPFAAAVALYKGSFGWDDYALLGNPDVEAIAARIDVRRDELLEGLRHPFGANIAVHTASGTMERTIADPSGEPGTFPQMSEIETKFMTLSRPVLGNRASSLFSLLDHIDAAGDIRHVEAEL
ncbi:MmgE/PrpD family protein [Mesorhizobium sp. YR577]|uniref:MmgE/PrpD family protein n=1 Tax=Mesorhizobium sp. YR577 TaxID=1884373 RepID=UPI0008EE2E0C|nr:MmgE/PrpD family protein [Mesorhizobium sp. YR577]SFU19553.1 2-methylcitrate dehydratase PrpD [Mesorhizobium sp. YR577]